jgi:ribbon-helix-helix CopG family protein
VPDPKMKGRYCYQTQSGRTAGCLFDPSDVVCYYLAHMSAKLGPKVSRSNLYLPTALMKELQAFSRVSGMPQAEIIRRALRAWLDVQKKS